MGNPNLLPCETIVRATSGDAVFCGRPATGSAGVLCSAVRVDNGSPERRTGAHGVVRRPLT